MERQPRPLSVVVALMVVAPVFGGSEGGPILGLRAGGEVEADSEADWPTDQLLIWRPAERRCLTTPIEKEGDTPRRVVSDG